MGGPPDDPALAALSLPFHAVPAVRAYLRVLEAWADRVNLTGARTPAARASLLVGSVLPVAELVASGTVLDIGSGNGSPGLVLAALRPELGVTLLEPRQRRWAFLREAARAMGRPDVQVLRLRHDQYPGPPADTVVLRALTLPAQGLAPLTAPGGQLLVLGRPLAPAVPFLEAPSPAPGIWRYRHPRST